MSKRREEKQEVLQAGKEYFLDYDLFTVEEIIKISQFFKLIQNINKGKRYNREEVLEKHKEYRSIINNISLEKKYDKEFEKEYECSIYQTIKNLGK